MVTLRRLADECRTGCVDDPATHWAESAARLLHDYGLERPPSAEAAQPMLPFDAPHRITTELYSVARGGLEGGPSIDVLLQVWYNTESLKSAFGIPLLLRCVPSFGPVPQHIWTELREASHALNAFTCAGRVLLIGHPDPFATRFEAIIDSSAIYALPTTLLAGMIDPPRGLSGQVLEHFPDDFVSGWVGDPALADENGSPKLSAFLRTFDVIHLLRLRIDQAGKK